MVPRGQFSIFSALAQLLDLACLSVVALILGVTHGEGLSGQHTVCQNAGEQLILFHGRQQKSNGIFGAAQLL